MIKYGKVSGIQCNVCDIVCFDKYVVMIVVISVWRMAIVYTYGILAMCQEQSQGL